MKRYTCGCSVEPESLADRCDYHRNQPCHTNSSGITCPPCYRKRLLSIGLDRSAIPTRHLPR